MKVHHKVRVNPGHDAYDIHIGQDLLSAAPDFLPFSLKGRSVFVLADEAVMNPHAATLYGALRRAGALRVEMLAIPGGEGAKSLEGLERVLSWLLDHGVDRKSVLFAVGGGVIGDLAGFAASVIVRGIPFVQVPTTLLAQVDSSVGGKTGVNMKQGKNLVGAFHQPAAVICDMDTLETLPRRELLAGYAEIVKYGLIGDRGFFEWLEQNGQAVCAREMAALAQAINVSCVKKAEIVAADEKEQTGLRALLNLGHTFGHALEGVAGYDGRLLHGEAVSIGMVLAYELSARMKLCGAQDAARVARHLAAAGLPTRIDMISPRLACGVEEIVGYMKRDKKNEGGKAVFILARGIGEAFVCDSVDMEDVRQVIQNSMAQGVRA